MIVPGMSNAASWFYFQDNSMEKEQGSPLNCGGPCSFRVYAPCGCA